MFFSVAAIVHYSKPPGESRTKNLTKHSNDIFIYTTELLYTNLYSCYRHYKKRMEGKTKFSI